jgi:hypothetical protein
MKGAALFSLAAALGMVALLSPVTSGVAQTATNVVVAFTTTNSTPLNLGFAGFTTELLSAGVEYGDTNMQQVAARLSPGWLLFPGGTTADAFDWSSGVTSQAWINVVLSNGNTSAATHCQNTYLPLLGKGGVWFSNFASLAANLGGAKIIVCVNGFTDTNAQAAAGAFAAFALSNHISVAAWELCNEPYLFTGTGNFFANGTDYATKMKPYRDAIKAVDSNAVVAVFFTDPAIPGNGWDDALINYTNKYSAAVVYHYYPHVPTNAGFADQMALDNGCLVSNSAPYVINHLVANNAANVRYLVTEMNPNLGNDSGVQNSPTRSLYAGIWAAEYVLRVSSIPQMLFAGSYQLVSGSGVDTTNEFGSAVITAANKGYVTNTVGLPFGYFLSAQGASESVAFWAINRSTAVYPTTVGTNGPTVPVDTNGIATASAVYAQAYQGGNGKRYVVLTNKGSNAVPVQITQDGVALTNQLLATFVTGNDPSAVNSNPPATNNIAIQTLTVTNPMTIPEYSVARLEWTVFNVPRPVVTLAVSKTNQNLKWTGLTNVVYNVQGVTNLLGGWTTLGRVANTATNFSFTNWNTRPPEFYRLAVP